MMSIPWHTNKCRYIQQCSLLPMCHTNSLRRTSTSIYGLVSQMIPSLPVFDQNFYSFTLSPPPPLPHTLNTVTITSGTSQNVELLGTQIATTSLSVSLYNILKVLCYMIRCFRAWRGEILKWSGSPAPQRLSPLVSTTMRVINAKLTGILKKPGTQQWEESWLNAVHKCCFWTVSEKNVEKSSMSRSKLFRSI
jgi:hypothetical protein